MGCGLTASNVANTSTNRVVGASAWVNWCRSTGASIGGLRIAGAMHLLVFVDDATGRLMHLQFVESESTFAYFHAARAYLEA
jgi:hypothetical protein